MRSGPGPTFTCSNQRLWRMIPSCRSSQAFQHGNARRKSGPVASLQHDRLSPASLSTQTEISRASLSEHPERTPVSYPGRGRNPYISRRRYIIRAFRYINFTYLSRKLTSRKPALRWSSEEVPRLPACDRQDASGWRWIRRRFAGGEGLRKEPRIIIIEIFREEGVRGTSETANRPAVSEMRESLNRNGMKLVLVKRVRRAFLTMPTMERAGPQTGSRLRYDRPSTETS